MRTNHRKNKGTKTYMRGIVLLLVAAVVYCGRDFYLDHTHPYRNLDVIGTWDYSYSVTYDEDWNEMDTDKELFSIDLYLNTEITLNDDGTYSLMIGGTKSAGIWEPTVYGNVYSLMPDDPEMSGLVMGNEIRFDAGDEELCLGMEADTAPATLSYVFREGEAYRYVFCRIHRDNTRMVYRDRD